MLDLRYCSYAAICHTKYYYNITAILQQQARVPISSVPILNFFQLICRIEIHRTLISCNLQKCALEQVQVADEQLGRSETKYFYRLQGRRVRLFISSTLQIRIFNQSGILCLAYSVQ